MARKIPRPFDLHFGAGVIAEEASHAGQHHEPTIQLLEFTEGDAAGTLSLRFCTFDTRGRFQRSPLIVSEADIPRLREALARTPRLHAVLRQLVE